MADDSAAAVINLPNYSVGLFAEADQSTLTRGHRSNTRRYASPVFVRVTF
jgi:hypothetical protein